MSEMGATKQGLTTKDAILRQAKYGKNQLVAEKKEHFLKKILHIVLEPMFLLLIIAAVIYFILGEPGDGAVMLVFVLGMIGIETVQEWKTDKTLQALKDLSAPHIVVLRDGEEKEIASEDLVPGDIMFIHEGVKVPADGIILRANDLYVDESSLTGEAEGVWKEAEDPLREENQDYWKKDRCYAGTMVLQGNARVRVTSIGSETAYGKIGYDVSTAEQGKTPLELQTGKLVKRCAGIAGVLFALVTGITYFNVSELAVGDRLVKSVLSGITLAMATIPEEFPVILTVFLSMGAWRLAKKQSLVRSLPAVETLGAVSVLCVDKTGTITLNQMQVQEAQVESGTREELHTLLGLSCETDAHDPMEQAMLAYLREQGVETSALFAGDFLGEYPFTNERKMMGHIWRHHGEIVIAAKGSPERILELCQLTQKERASAEEQVRALSSKGLRVIAVASMNPKTQGEIPQTLEACRLQLAGLIGLADPPRESVRADIAALKHAGIKVMMITGDNGNTAAAIGEKVGISTEGDAITGTMLDAMDDEALRQCVKTATIFARVVPAHKMRIVRALQENGEVVAMTGDGVNDAPALKHADIGIAMGKRGSDVSREAADIILMDDNFTTITETVRDGRRIYDNIRKAVGYVFAIHIPIALSSLLAPLLGIAPVSLFLLPLHVVLLEIIIDPTCSVVLERQPEEPDLMVRPPRKRDENLLTKAMVVKNVFQGFVVFLAAFGAYYLTLRNSPDNAPLGRAMGIGILMLANLFLVQVNSSERNFAFTTFRKLRRDKVMWAVNIVTLLGLAVILYTPLNDFLKLAPLSLPQLLFVVAIAFISVFWYELVKWVRMRKRKRQS